MGIAVVTIVESCYGESIGGSKKGSEQANRQTDRQATAESCTWLVS